MYQTCFLGRSDTLEATHADVFGDETKMDMSNLTTSYQVPTTPNTRIHKDHSLDHVIGDIQTGVQTRGMTKNTDEHGFISAVYEGKTHEDLHTCLFACFLSQEEPKRTTKALSDPAWVEAMQEELLYKAVLSLYFLYGLHGISDVCEECFPLCESTVWLALSSKSLVYIDDIIFGSTNKELCTKFKKLMHDKFQMSSMGELNFFLGLQVKQREDGIFISQDKYVAKILRKFGFTDVRTASTPIDTEKPLLKDSDGDDVDVHLYRSMIGSLMYLTSSRPDIMFAVCACARFQVTPKVSCSHAVKRIFRYLKGQPNLGLWYPRNSPFDLVAYFGIDYAGASLDGNSTIGGCQFLGCRLISWQCKKQTVVATSSTEAEYMAAASCCGQVLCIHNQMLDYGYNFMHTMINIDNNREANNVNMQSRMDGRTCNIKQKCVMNQTPRQLKRGRDTKIPQSSGPLEKVGDEAVHKELGDRMERAATTASSLEAEQDSGNINRTQSMEILNEQSP
ncbi:putative ribonuclease H-like domain-containing protein [Tanacetum coccineum]